MPRPFPPPPATAPAVSPFNLGDEEKCDLARSLGLKSLSSQAAGMIAAAIANYKATEAGSRDTTIGNTLAALGELKKKGPAYQKAVRRLADDRSGIDYATHAVLQPLAKAALGNDLGAQEALARAAGARADELRKHKRVDTAIEPLRLFCGWLRLIFNRIAAPELRCTEKEGWRHCRRFAIEVFTVADITHADFDAHPDRLTEYLGTDVTAPQASQMHA